MSLRLNQLPSDEVVLVGDVGSVRDGLECQTVVQQASLLVPTHDLASDLRVHSGEYTTLEVAELFGVGRSTVYRAIQRQRLATKAALVDASTRR